MFASVCLHDCSAQPTSGGRRSITASQLNTDNGHVGRAVSEHDLSSLTRTCASPVPVIRQLMAVTNDGLGVWFDSLLLKQHDIEEPEPEDSPDNADNRNE